jgi:hypothetical protein
MKTRPITEEQLRHVLAAMHPRPAPSKEFRQRIDAIKERCAHLEKETTLSGEPSGSGDIFQKLVNGRYTPADRAGRSSIANTPIRDLPRKPALGSQSAAAAAADWPGMAAEGAVRLPNPSASNGKRRAVESQSQSASDVHYPTDDGPFNLWTAARALALCLLIPLLLGGLHSIQPKQAPQQLGRQLKLNQLNASQRALKEAQRCWCQAQREVNAEFEVLEAWDPAMEAWTPGTESKLGNREEWRRNMMASDRHGFLREARKAVMEAQRLARTPRDIVAASLIRCRIECDSGNHVAELREARKLVTLAPQNKLALITLKRATTCNQPKALVKQATTKTLHAGVGSGPREDSGAGRVTGTQPLQP